MPATKPENAPLTAVDRDDCRALEQALETEWLECDGRGGYASSTVVFCPTRRYHGLFVGRPEGSEKRHVFVSRFEELALLGEKTFPLSIARYPDVFSPLGHLALERFELAPWPTSTYRFGDVELVREVLAMRGRAGTLVRYRVQGGEVQLDLRPFLPMREADALTVENDVLDPTASADEDGFSCRPYAELPAVHVTTAKSDCRFVPEPLWYKDLVLPAETERGYPDREDQFTPGRLQASIADGGQLVIAVCVDEPVADPAAAWKRETRRRRAAVTEAGVAGAKRSSTGTRRAAVTADDFLVRTGSGRLGVNAGYPWFGEWGRDTFLSLPGLTLALGRLDECAEVLSGALDHLADGLLPNVFGETPETSSYGSADASLWYARAVLLYDRAGGDEERLFDEYLPALEEIAESYRAGTGLGIRGDEGELVHVGSPELNPTWMDAVTPDGAVTPRAGFPVEINALWISLLHHLALLAEAAGDRSAEKSWTAYRRTAKRSFLERFWDEKKGLLADVWSEDGADWSVRPNMVIAASLELSPLTRAQRKHVVEHAQKELLTPKGLRTLSPRHPGYVGTYAGSPEERDAAYHQGTVWPWLLGFYAEAWLRANGTKKKELAAMAELFDHLEEELDRAGLNHLSEVFGGDPPHRPGGTPAQAWNTAELLRARAMLARGRP